jgi:competence protein ComFB
VVNQVCDDEEARETPSYLTTDECRMDVACFVLNRIPQRYVSSARGQAHIEQEIENDQQLFVDLVTLSHEGLRRVTSVQRSFYGNAPDAPAVQGPHFFFPTVKTRLFDANTFTAAKDVPVALLRDDSMVRMVDSRWQNPFTVAEPTGATVLFWPQPAQAAGPDESGRFEFEIRVESDGYESLHHFFTIERISTNEGMSALIATGEHRIPDLYLVPSE